MRGQTFGGRTIGVAVAALAIGACAPDEPRVQGGAPARVVGDEFGMDAPVYGMAHASTYNPAIAFDGTNYLAVWSDVRSTFMTYAARMTPAGKILDPAGLPLGEDAAFAAEPAVAAGGGVFLVAHGTTEGVEIVRVDPSGAVLDRALLNHSKFQGAAEDAAPEVAFDGTNFLVVWQSETSVLMGARVDPAGKILDPGGVSLEPIDWNADKHLTCGGGVCLVVVGGETQGSAARLGPDLAVLDPGGLPLAPAGHAVRSPAAHFDGTQFVIAYGDAAPSGEAAVAVRRLLPGGVMVDPAGVTIVAFPPGTYTLSMALGTDGAGTLAAWSIYDAQGSFETYFARLGQNIVPLVQAATPVAAQSTRAPAFAFDGTNALLAWHTWQDRQHAIVASRIGPQGAFVDTPPLVVSTSANPQSDPAVGWDGANFLVAWNDGRELSTTGNWAFRATRVTPEGAVLDPAGIVVSSGELAEFDTPTRVIFDGQRFIAAWQPCHDNGYAGEHKAWPVDGQGVVAPELPLGVGPMECQDMFGLARASSGSLLVLPTPTTSNGMLGVRIDQAGGVSAPVLLDAKASQYSVSVTFDGTNNLVVWAQSEANVHTLRGMRIDAQGSALDPGGFAIADEVGTMVAGAFDGTNHVIFYHSNPGEDLRAARVSPAGAVLDPQGIVIASQPGCAFGAFRPTSAAFDGERTVFAWTDCGAEAGTDIRGATVAPDGAVSTFAITADAYFNVAPALAGTGQGTALVTYQSFRREMPYGTHRVFARLLSAPVAGSVAAGGRGG